MANPTPFEGGPVPPSELSEQIALVRALSRANIEFFAVPNGGRRSRLEGARLRASGVMAGGPDLILVTPPKGSTMPTALELKRSDGKPYNVGPKQREWLDRLQGLGWSTVVAFGCSDAIKRLRLLGYEL